MMVWWHILVGVILLISGRKVFWLLVAALGVITALKLIGPLLGGVEPVVVVAIALGAGLLGALLAIFLQQLAISVAGFLAGGFLAVVLATHFGVAGLWLLLVWLIGGLVGSSLLAIFFEYALIFLSSAAGAALISQSVGIQEKSQWIAFVVLTLVGVAVQLTGSSETPRRHRPG